MLCPSMPFDQPPITVDARGLRCPWPVLRLDRALRDGATVVDLLCDDVGAPAEIAAYAAERGRTLMVIPGGFRVGA